MVQGRLDQVAPGDAAQRYASSLEAPSKQLVWFENSAHTPHLEEPEKFRELLMRVRAVSSPTPDCDQSSNAQTNDRHHCDKRSFEMRQNVIFNGEIGEQS